MQQSCEPVGSVAAYADVEHRQIFQHAGHVISEHRQRVLQQQPVTIWLTGLSGAGKSTLAYEMERQLLARNRLSFVLDGGRKQAHAVLDALQLIDISNNIGDSRSLMCHPASTTHHNMGPEGREAMGISEGMLRINVGLEDPDDLIEDLDQAFAKAGL